MVLGWGERGRGMRSEKGDGEDIYGVRGKEGGGGVVVEGGLDGRREGRGEGVEESGFGVRSHPSCREGMGCCC